MKHYVLFLSIFLLFSCNPTKHDLELQKVELSNFHFTIPNHLSYQEVFKEMALAKIIGREIAIISIFNFGNKAISLEANLARWRSQLKEVTEEKIEKLDKGLIYYIEIEGVDNSEVKTYILAAIIPSDEGPYYLKAVCTERNYAMSKAMLLEILKSIEY